MKGEQNAVLSAWCPELRFTIVDEAQVPDPSPLFSVARSSPKSVAARGGFRGQDIGGH